MVSTKITDKEIKGNLQTEYTRLVETLKINLEDYADGDINIYSSENIINTTVDRINNQGKHLYFQTPNKIDLLAVFLFCFGSNLKYGDYGMKCTWLIDEMPVTFCVSKFNESVKFSLLAHCLFDVKYQLPDFMGIEIPSTNSCLLGNIEMTQKLIDLWINNLGGVYCNKISINTNKKMSTLYSHTLSVVGNEYIYTKNLSE